jgi:hypothetical protein
MRRGRFTFLTVIRRQPHQIFTGLASTMVGLLLIGCGIFLATADIGRAQTPEDPGSSGRHRPKSPRPKTRIRGFLTWRLTAGAMSTLTWNETGVDTRQGGE